MTCLLHGLVDDNWRAFERAQEGLSQTSVVAHQNRLPGEAEYHALTSGERDRFLTRVPNSGVTRGGDVIEIRRQRSLRAVVGKNFSDSGR
jgi:hypothetical protein